VSLDSRWQVAVAATDTVWGLICRIDSDQAEENVARIYAIKQREASKPLILFGQDLETLMPYVSEWGSVAEELARKYWPGALTIIVRRSPLLANWINPGEEYIGLRVPKSPSVMQLLDRVSNGVLLSTSANLSGEEPVQDYREACMRFSKQVDLILEPSAEETVSNSASTIVKITNNKLEILRQGDIIL
jgi:L-threonylcarbamoyladenylate synthase